MENVSSARILLHFDVHQPIELVDLTLSFGALAKQYRKFLIDQARADGRKINDADVKLFITKIENNCILAELAGASQILASLVPLLEYSKIFMEFVNNIGAAIDYFKALGRAGKADPGQIPYSKRQCEDYANFLKVVAGNEEGRLGLSVAEYGKTDGEVTTLTRFVYSGAEAYEAQKGALIAQRTLEQKGDADYKNVLMYFHQTNIEDPKSDGRTGDKAIIKSISDKPLPVFFISDLDSDKVKSFVDDPKMNPFKSSYRVDVNVELDRNEIPKFYRVLRLHEIIPDE